VSDGRGRAAEATAAARAILERDGEAALTMRAVADQLGIRAPSLYKHVAGKAAIELALIEAALAEMGEALRAALARPGRRGPVAALLAAYRRHALAHRNVYRLATAGPLRRNDLTPGLEDWAGEPFLTVTGGDEHRARALWALAHGLVVLELDERFPPGADLERAWSEGAAAFGGRPSEPESITVRNLQG
jgi:AcrR family transcriptional regulator